MWSDPRTIATMLSPTIIARECLRSRLASLLALSPRVGGPAGRAPLRGGGSPTAAWAARRAAAMKFDFPPGSGMTGGLAEPSAASEAAMRSAGEAGWRPRLTPEPGSSGWSGGRFGSIGRRSLAAAAIDLARLAAIGPGAAITGLGGAIIGFGAARSPCGAVVASTGGAGGGDGIIDAAGSRACVVLPRIPVSIMASRSTTCPSVPWTASSKSWVFFSVCLRSATSRWSASTSGGRPAAAPEVRYALVLEMDQQLGKPALDRLEMVETGVGGVELLDQHGDPVLEVAERHVIAAGELDPLDLVDQSRHHGFHLARHVMAVAVARFERIRERGDPALEVREHVAAAAGGDLVDLVAKRAHLVGEFRQRVVGRRMRDDAAHRDDRPFELLERRRILAVAGDQVDLVRELPHRFVDDDEILGRRHGAQGVAHFGEPAFDAGDGGTIGAGVAGVVDAVRELADFAFERLDRLARHRLLQHGADLGKVVAQRVDRLVEPAGPAERLDLCVDLAKLALETGKLLGPRPRQRVGRHRRLRGSGRIAVEGALPVRDLHERQVERSRGIGGHGRARLFAAGVGDRAVDRAHPSLDLAGRGTLLHDQLVEPAVELGDDVGQLARRLVLQAGRALRIGGTEPRKVVELPRQAVEAMIELGDPVIDPRSGVLGHRSGVLRLAGWAIGVIVGRRMVPVVAHRRTVMDLGKALVGRGPAEFVAADGPIGIIVAGGMATVVAHRGAGAAVIFGISAPLRLRVVAAIRVSGWIVLRTLMRSGLGGFVGCRIDDDGIEPLLDRHSRAASGFARGLLRLPPHLHLPGNARFHARIQVQQERSGSRSALAGLARVDMRWMVRRPVLSGHSFSGLG